MISCGRINKTRKYVNNKGITIRNKLYYGNQMRENGSKRKM